MAWYCDPSGPSGGRSSESPPKDLCRLGSLRARLRLNENWSAGFKVSRAMEPLSVRASWGWPYPRGGVLPSLSLSPFIHACNPYVESNCQALELWFTPLAIIAHQPVQKPKKPSASCVSCRVAIEAHMGDPVSLRKMMWHHTLIPPIKRAGLSLTGFLQFKCTQNGMTSCFLLRQLAAASHM